MIATKFSSGPASSLPHLGSDSVVALTSLSSGAMSADVEARPQFRKLMEGFVRSRQAGFLESCGLSKGNTTTVCWVFLSLGNDDQRRCDRNAWYVGERRWNVITAISECTTEPWKDFKELQ